MNSQCPVENVARFARNAGYVSAFHTHLAALWSCRTVQRAGAQKPGSPVPGAYPPARRAMIFSMADSRTGTSMGLPR